MPVTGARSLESQTMEAQSDRIATLEAANATSQDRISCPELSFG